MGLTIPVLLDDGLRTFNRHGIVALPSTVVIGSKGKVLFRLAGYPLVGRENLFDLLEAAFQRGKETPSVKTTGSKPHPAATRYYGLARAMGCKGHLEAEERNLLKAETSAGRRNS